MSDDLEQELRSLAPLPPTAALDARIAHRLLHSEFRPSPLADKFLLATLSLATAAAVLIVTLLASDYLNTPPSPTPAQVAADSTSHTTLAETQRLLAQLTNDNTGLPPAAQATQPRF